MNNNLIEIKNLSKSYPDFKLNIPDLSIRKGKIIGLIGENGSGKTTLIKSLLGLIQIDKGEITFPNLKAFKEEIGVVFDTLCFNENLTPKEIGNILKLAYFNWNKKEYKKYLKEFKLKENKKIKEFSKGMKTKLQLACALAHNPKLLILDEPTSGLDPIIKEEILEILYDYIQDKNHTILISSHNLKDLEQISDQIIFISNGHLILNSTSDYLLSSFKIGHLSKEEIEKLDKNKIIRIIPKDYSIDVLLKDTEDLKFETEIPELNDIFLFLIKGLTYEKFTA